MEAKKQKTNYVVPEAEEFLIHSVNGILQDSGGAGGSGQGGSDDSDPLD